MSEKERQKKTERILIKKIKQCARARTRANKWQTRNIRLKTNRI